MEIFAKYKNKSKDKLVQYALDFVMLLVFWGGLLRKSYNYDTVYHMVVDDADVMTRIRGGRYAAALIDYVLLKLGFRTTTNISITILITFIILAAAMLGLQLLFARWQPDNQWARAGFWCGLNLIFLNVLFAESLMFGEYSIYFALAYLAAVCGVIFFSKKKYLPMILMYLLAVSFYQNGVVAAAILTAFYICLDEKMVLSLKSVIREALAIAVCMGIGALDLLSIRVLERFNIIPASGKVSGMGNIIGKLSEAVSNFISLNKNAVGIMPNLWLPFLFTLIVWITIIYSRFKEHKLTDIVFLFIVWLGSNALLYVIPLASMDFYCPPRLSFCFFMVQGLLLVSAYAISTKTLHKFIGVIGVLYLMLHFLFSSFIVSDHFVSNSLDEVYVNMLCEEIEDYESETGIKVTKLAVMKDTYSPSFYRQISYTTGQINERTIDAVPVSIIQVLTGRHFEKVDMSNDIREKYFKDKNWDYIDLDEQLIIEGDTAYWCIF